MKRKLIALIAAGAMMLTLTACGSSGGTASTAPSENAVATNAPAEISMDESEPAAAAIEPLILSPEANVSGVESYTAQNGALESVSVNQIAAGNTIIAKYVFSTPNKRAVEENAVDLIQNQGGALFDEIQVWAVDGSGTKFLAFTIDQPAITDIANGSVSAGTLQSVATEWESY